jgi:carbon storage regulator
MLVITRRVGEKVRIGRDIEVMVSYVRDGRVRLAIKAPPEILVARTELLDPKRVTK